MKNEYLFTLTMLAAVVSFTGSAWAQPVCDTIFTGDESNEWGNDLNWTNQRPDASKVACIPADKSVMICLAAAAKAIWIQADQTSQGEVRSPDYGGTLTLGNPADLVDSRIDGRLIFDGDENRSLEIASHVTIIGNGGEILGRCFITFPNKPAVIKSIGGAWTLTLQGVDNSTRGTSLLLHGRFNIEVALVNNAYVVADHAEPAMGDGLIALNAGPNSGTGYWIAEDSANGVGTLQINASVSGSGTWIVQNDYRAEIRINAPSTSLTGDVFVYNGTFLVRENFTTQGNFTIQDDGTGGAVPQAIVRQGRVARFNVPPPP